MHGVVVHLVFSPVQMGNGRKVERPITIIQTIITTLMLLQISMAEKKRERERRERNVRFAAMTLIAQYLCYPVVWPNSGKRNDNEVN